jgi:choice-of-anchor B domain-containing protein
MTMRRILVSCAWVALLAVGCGDNGPSDPVGGGPPPPDPGSPASVAISPGAVTFGAVGSAATLSAVVKDSDGNILPSAAVAWTIAAPGIITVDGTSGVVTAVANGTMAVRATSGSAQSSIDVTVAQVPVSLSLGAATTGFSLVGSSTMLQPVAADSNGNTINGISSLTFASTNASAVHVTNQGMVTANGSGSADISVAVGSLSSSATFSVTITGPVGSAILGGEVPCVGGMAGPFTCDRMDLVSYLPLAGLGANAAESDWMNDMWGWTDPSTSKEYALVGRRDGVTFVDLSDPERPQAVGHLPSATAPTAWRDLKVYQDHAYVVADASPGHGVQIFDLRRLRGVDVFTTFTEDGRYTGVSSVHNIVINEATGFAYTTGNSGGGTTCGGGLHMIDLSNLTSPSFAGCFSDPTTGRIGTGYTHDAQCVVYSGLDADYTGQEICVGANETAISVADVTNKGNPIAISTATYPDVGYVHQGWFTEDHAFFIQNDELDERDGLVSNTRMLVWDMSDLDDPILVDEHLGPTGAIDHNMYVKGSFLYHSNYHFGIRVVDVSNPMAAVEAGFFDTHPPDDAASFDGSWSNYPFFDSGIVVVTSAREGLFVLRHQP